MSLNLVVVDVELQVCFGVYESIYDISLVSWCFAQFVCQWHLGFFKYDYTPTKRGFDSFFGYWLGAGDYWDQSEAEMYGSWGLDLRNNTEVHVLALKFPLYLKSHTKSDSWEPLQIPTAQYLIIIVVVVIMIMIIIIIGGRFRIFCKRGCTTKE